MRARGAQGADIAILVVAADDGVMPTTREALNHARAAGVPIVVALNKIDKNNANPDRVKQQLMEVGLTPDDWGGDTLVVPVSAKAEMGIEDLLQAINLIASETTIKANPDRSARGVVLESRIEEGRGSMATLLVQNGTLNTGDIVVAGLAHGRIKAMFDENGNKVTEAPPSKPVSVMGLDDTPTAGQEFEVVKDIKVARNIVSDLQQEMDEEASSSRGAQTLEQLFARFQAGETSKLRLIIKSDVQGSLEPIKSSLLDLKLEDGGPSVEIIHDDVGDVTENDVNLAQSSHAIVIGFNVDVDNAARRTAENNGIDIRTYSIIYKLIEDIELALHGLLEPEYEDRIIGVAEVRAVFKIPKIGYIAGCYVSNGVIRRNAKVRVVRDGRVVAENQGVSSLKRIEEDVREVRSGFECGVGLGNFQNFQEGDELEFLVTERVN
jgi:translation initiation factor IF-2